MKKTDKKIGFKNLIIYLLLFAYGVLALYSLYVVLPEGLKWIFVIAMFLGGFMIPLYAPILFGEISDREKASDANYFKTILLTIYAIPILLLGTYHIKLNLLEKSDYRFDNDELIKYKYSIDYEVNDVADPDSQWNFTLKDYSDETRFEPGKVYEVNEYDIVSYILDINCSSHAITDPNNSGANLNGTTIQRRMGFFAGDNLGLSKVVEGTVLLNDKEGNDITVDIRISFNRVLSVWDVLKAHVDTSSNDLNIFDVAFMKCPNADKYTSLYELEDEIDTDVILVSNDEERKLVYFTQLKNKDVMVTMAIGENGIYENVNTTTYPAMQIDEANKYFDVLMKELKVKYGEDSENDYYVENYLWLHETDDKAIILTKDDYEDGFSVSCYVTKRYKESNGDDSSEIRSGQSGDGTWDELKEYNNGELQYDTLTEEEQDLVNYPTLNVNEVFWTPNGKSYHSVDWCYTLSNSNTILNGTLEEAKKEGKADPCSKCVGE